MIPEKTLNDYLDEKGYSCIICAETYSASDRDKMPTQLSCLQHSICMKCFTDAMNNLTIKNCPECRKPLTFQSGSPVVPNSQVISAMDTITDLWKAKNSPAATTSSSAAASSAAITSSSSAASSAAITSSSSSATPKNFSCVSLCETVHQYPNVIADIESALPAVVNTMGWQTISGELQEELATPVNWVLMRDKKDQPVQAIAKVETTGTEWKMHWTGVVANNTQDYLDFYIHILASLMDVAQKNPTSNTWQKASLLIVFNYDTEEKWLEAVEAMLTQHHIRYDKLHDHKAWGTQVKLTAYPYPKIGHLQPPYACSQARHFETPQKFSDWVKPLTQNYIDQYQLTQFFRLCSFDEYQPEQAAFRLKNAFLQEPESFFVYTIDNQSKGFIRFTRENGKLAVQECKLISQASQYADHFIQQFITWASTKPIYSRGSTAGDVNFLPCLEKMHGGALFSAVAKGLK